MFEHPENEPVLTLDDSQCRMLLERTKHGRLAFTTDRGIEILPVNFVLDGDDLVIRTAPGTKLKAFKAGQRMSFQADGILPDQAWSVLVRGRGRVLNQAGESQEAEEVGVTPWVPTFKDFYVALALEEFDGRHFIFGNQPERGDDPFRYKPASGGSNGDLPDNPDTSKLSR